MDYNDDNNPFADPSSRNAATNSFSSNGYNPFESTAAPTQPVTPPQQSYAAPVPSYNPPPIYNSSPPTPVYQPPTPVYQPSTPVYQPPTPVYQPPSPPPPSVYQSPSQPAAYLPASYDPISIPTPTPQTSPKYDADPKQISTRVDLSQHDKQQAELQEREKRLAERERALANSTNSAASTNRENNFPPLPKCCPCRPCFYHNISADIPGQFQRWVRLTFILWIIYSITLFLNMIAALSYFIIDKDGATTFGLSIVYFVLFIPATYIGWFRSLYRAFRVDSSVAFMFFFIVGAIFAVMKILFAIGFLGGMCGFFRIGLMSKNKVVGIMMIVLGCLWSGIAVASILLIIMVHRLYRNSGASIEQAQRELRSTLVNNETVRGAAREAATAGINEAVRSSGYKN